MNEKLEKEVKKKKEGIGREQTEVPSLRHAGLVSPLKKGKIEKKEFKKEEVKKETKNEGTKKTSEESKENLIELSFKTLKFVYMTEKAIKNIEKENKLVFIVNRMADKNEIKAAVETEYNEKVLNVNTMIDQKGRKKATVKFEKPNAAGDIAIKLGII